MKKEIDPTFAALQGRETVAAVHDRLRGAILRGELQPGDTLSTVQLSVRYGVSRTPLREALRMLQEEGLVVASSNQRARVAGFDADELELVYASRLLLSSVATALTVPRLSAADVAELRGILAEMNEAAEQGDSDGWQTLDRRFHGVHTRHASPSVQRELGQLYERAALYRRMWLRDEPHRLPASDMEHAQIVDACARADVGAAVSQVARHLSRIALTLLAQTVPEREPLMVRTALKMALASQA